LNARGPNASIDRSHSRQRPKIAPAIRLVSAEDAIQAWTDGIAPINKVRRKGR
jgi:hypothetical protein